VASLPHKCQPPSPPLDSIRVMVKIVPEMTYNVSSGTLSLYTATTTWLPNWAALTYSARRYDSAVCCSKMSRDAFLSEVLYEADKALKKFAAAPRECVCLQDGGRSRRLFANICFILLFCVVWVLTASIFVYVCFVDCCIAANRWVMQQDREALTCSDD